MEEIKQWILENPTLFKVFKYILLVTIVFILIQVFRRFLKKNITDTSA